MNGLAAPTTARMTLNRGVSVNGRVGVGGAMAQLQTLQACIVMPCPEVRRSRYPRRDPLPQIDRPTDAPVLRLEGWGVFGGFVIKGGADSLAFDTEHAADGVAETGPTAGGC